MVLARLASSGGQMGIPTDDAIMDEGRDSSMEIDSENPNSSSAMKDVSFSPRGYQLEMLEASMNQNIIVAVRFQCHSRDDETDPIHRWILAVGRLICMSTHFVVIN